MTNRHNKQPKKGRERSNPQAQMQQLLSDISQKKYQKIVVMAGAGISTAAGIPDFRSPQTGLYANLKKYNLPYPEAVFDISYLRENPEPFFLLAGEMYPTQFQPTTFHLFIKWISDLGCLKRVFTQNIDTLERIAGIPSELIVEAHGSFATSRCIDCKRSADKDEIEDEILVKKSVPKCKACKGIVKPDIVFFGEGLPERFFDLLDDFDDVDLAIVAGTSLQVGPFNQLPDMVPQNVPRWLMNIERVGSLGKRKHDALVLGPLEELDEVINKFINPATVSEGSMGAVERNKDGNAANSEDEKSVEDAPDIEKHDAAKDEPNSEDEKLTVKINKLTI